ncbi:MAG: hypothetical protein ABL901_01555 [Hyphomicrobiaceae bacterium]
MKCGQGGVTADAHSTMIIVTAYHHRSRGATKDGAGEPALVDLRPNSIGPLHAAAIAKRLKVDPPFALPIAHQPAAPRLMAQKASAI